MGPESPASAAASASRCRRLACSHELSGIQSAVTPANIIGTGSSPLTPVCKKSIGPIGRMELLMGSNLTATGRHLPYGITQCYLLPDTNERAPP